MSSAPKVLSRLAVGDILQFVSSQSPPAKSRPTETEGNNTTATDRNEVFIAESEYQYIYLLLLHPNGPRELKVDP